MNIEKPGQILRDYEANIEEVAKDLLKALDENEKAVEAPSSPQGAPEDSWREQFDKLPRKVRRALYGAAKRDTRRKAREDHRKLREERRAAGVAPFRIERLG